MQALFENTGEVTFEYMLLSITFIFGRCFCPKQLTIHVFFISICDPKIPT